MEGVYEIQVWQFR